MHVPQNRSSWEGSEKYFWSVVLPFLCLSILFPLFVGCGIENDSIATNSVLASIDVGTIAGFVVAADDGGGRAAGELIPGAIVVLDTGQKTTTGSDGRFTLKNVSVGDHQIAVYFKGDDTHPALPHTFQTISVSKGSIFPITLKASSVGGSSRDLESDEPTGNLFGTILSDSSGVIGATIKVQLLDGESGEEIKSATAAGDGTFSMTAVPIGIWKLRAAVLKSDGLEDTNNWEPNSTSVIVEDSTSAVIPENPFEQVILKVTKIPVNLETVDGKAFIGGTILDSLSNKPLSVVIINIDNGTRVISNGSGYWQVKNLPKGTHKLTFSKEGYSDSKHFLEVVGDQKIKWDNIEYPGGTTVPSTEPVIIATETMVFEIHKQSTLAGTIYGSDGKPVTDGHEFSIVAFDDSDGLAYVFQVVRASTDPTTLGQWKVDNVPPNADKDSHYGIYDGYVLITNVLLQGTDKYTSTITTRNGGTAIALTYGFFTEPGKTTLMDAVLPSGTQNSSGLASPTLLTLGDTDSHIPVSASNLSLLTNQNVFQWTQVGGATSYIFEIFQDNLSASRVTDNPPPLYSVHGDSAVYSTVISASSVSLPNTASLRTDTNYYWTVRATDGSNTSPYAKPHLFRVVADTNLQNSTSTILPTPVLTSLGSGTTVVTSVTISNLITTTTKDTFSWTPISGATQYVLEVFKEITIGAGFVHQTAAHGDAVAWTRVVTAPAASLDNAATFTLATNYYWTVRAFNGVASESSGYATPNRFLVVAD